MVQQDGKHCDALGNLVGNDSQSGQQSKIVADLKTGTYDHAVYQSMQAHAKEGDQPHRMRPGAAIVMTVDVQVDMVLLFMTGMDLQVMLKEMEDDESEHDKERSINSHLE
jgi:hypothetical protein